MDCKSQSQDHIAIAINQSSAASKHFTQIQQPQLNRKKAYAVNQTKVITTSSYLAVKLIVLSALLNVLSLIGFLIVLSILAKEDILTESQSTWGIILMIATALPSIFATQTMFYFLGIEIQELQTNCHRYGRYQAICQKYGHLLQIVISSLVLLAQISAIVVNSFISKSFFDSKNASGILNNFYFAWVCLTNCLPALLLTVFILFAPIVVIIQIMITFCSMVCVRNKIQIVQT